VLEVEYCPLRLQPDASRVVVRPFHVAVEPKAQRATKISRVERIVRYVEGMTTSAAIAELGLVLRDFETRHWQTRNVFMDRYRQIEAEWELDGTKIPEEKKQLIGAYFCHEYSYAAAALMNPSIVLHPDQSGLSEGSRRVVMSLRAVGEGHISTVAFREGILSPGAVFDLAPEPPFATAANSATAPAEDGSVCVHRHQDTTLSGTVIFPMTAQQRNGLEDLRLVQFTHDDGSTEYVGTYTAYSGANILSEMMRTHDFRSFDLVPMTGEAARNKGMGLFPRKLDGRYAMIGRQDGESLFLLWSDKLTHWEGGEKILEPKYPWEQVQIGNCGAPIELDEGWLLLTHGVGAMRKYSIGAALLDKQDPSKVLARTSQPLLSAADEDREGYVPNVVYTCGALKHGELLFLPYGVADSLVAFAFVGIKDLLKAMR
jgi:predicted GH43/DUF377 family glycosyl hydrolase